jgi:hypothetical protein
MGWDQPRAQLVVGGVPGGEGRGGVLAWGAGTSSLPGTRLSRTRPRAGQKPHVGMNRAMPPVWVHEVGEEPQPRMHGGGEEAPPALARERRAEEDDDKWGVGSDKWGHRSSEGSSALTWY